MAADQPLKLAVIWCDGVAMMHTGADLERRVRVFEMPPEMAEYVRAVQASDYATISFAVVEEG